MTKLLNLGCGSTYSPDWVNVDIEPRPPHVLGYDLLRGIPFPADTFDVVYHSHLLEHLPRKAAVRFLQECFRVLQPGGILRVAVPDLEGITRAYLEALDAAKRGEDTATDRHAWTAIELLDQMTRHQSGGEMLDFWQQAPVATKDFILSRVGAGIAKDMEEARRSQDTASATAHPFLVGRFRQSGECRLWMYDRISLETLLVQTGFTNVRQTTAATSDITEWAQYHLEVEQNGAIRKPDSLFMEARKPDRQEAQDNTTSAPIRVAAFCMKHDGGAGGAAQRLNLGLNSAGASSFLYVVSSSTPAENAAVIPAFGPEPLVRDESSGQLNHPSWPAYHAATKNRLLKYPNRSKQCEIFSDAGATTELAHLPGLDMADIIHLHWIPGTVDMQRDVDFLRGRPIVWTLHDMNPITGGCHYAEECRRFEQHCGACPQLASKEEQDYSREQWINKKMAYRQLDITVVCPSHWLASEVRKSSLLGKADIHVIPNGVPTDIFKPLQRQEIRRAIGLSENDYVVVFGADSLHTRRKGFPELVSALAMVREQGHAPVLLTFGGGEPGELDKLPVRCLHLGALRSQQYLAMVYNAADCLVIPSLADNLPNIVLEALACGIPVVGFSTGGIPDVVQNHKTGRLVTPGDCEGLCAAILGMMAYPKEKQMHMRLLCRQAALEHFTLLQQGKAYKALYERLLNRRKNS